MVLTYITLCFIFILIEVVASSLLMQSISSKATVNNDQNHAKQIFVTINRVSNERYNQPTDYDEDFIIDKRKIRKFLQLTGGSVIDSKYLKLPQIKSFLQIGLTALNFCCWLVPLKNKKFINNKSLLSYTNVFAGGIFLMLCFDHMIPDSMNILTSNGYNNKLSLYFTLVGFVTILFIEKIAFDTSIIHQEDNTKVLSQMSAIVLAIAISLHSLFETMALGLATDTTSAILLSSSIALHQPAESIALLVAFLKTSMPVSSIMKWLTFCSLVGPIGLVVGILISQLSIPLVEGLVIALTAGTFLYVGASEIVSEEFENIKGIQKYYKFLTFISGFILMGGIHFITESLS